MRVVFLHPVEYLNIGIPQGISLLAAILEKAGHDVQVIDTTFMKPQKIKRSEINNSILKPTKYDLYDLVERSNCECKR